VLILVLIVGYSFARASPEAWSKDEDGVGLFGRALSVFLVAVLVLPGLFFFVIGLAKTFIGFTDEIRRGGPLWMLYGAAFLAAYVFCWRAIFRSSGKK
jgi:hypothetical protein